MVTRKVRYSSQRRWYQSPKASIPSTIAYTANTAPTSFRVLDCSEKARSTSYLVKNAVIGRPAVARARLQVGDDAKHLVPQRVALAAITRRMILSRRGLAAERQVDLLARWRQLAGRRGRSVDRQPGVASQAAMPAHAPHIARRQRVVCTKLAGVDADQLVPGEAADDQLVVKTGPEAAGLDHVNTRQM